MYRAPIRTQPTYDLPVRWDFPCRTNSDYTEELSFQVGSEYLDLTDHTFELQIKSAINGELLKTLSTVASPSLEGVYPVEPSRGFVQIRVHYETLKFLYQDMYPDYMQGDGISLPHDFLVTLPSGDSESWMFGYFNISKGITNG